MAGFFRRALIYLGLVEDDEFEEMLEYDEVQPAAVEPVVSRRAQREEARLATVQPVPSRQVRVHMVEPKSFNDAEQIGQKFKADIPVIINLQQADAELSKRLIDFASGLTYGLDGGIQRVAERVFLLTPHNVEVSAEDKRWLREKGFFNQF
ncbi:MAG: cell division protein SepF [Actinobacteria bacterium]|nr:cell division protein SepF [Actinomycetota bacterium]MDI6829917.1 cell division protein SepF [Actinomycetota bacterium]